MKKINCWEYKGCGREPNGIHSDEGVCPASVERRLDSVHGGEKAGRACWVISGVMCESEKRGTLALKYRRLMKTCVDCDFYQLVRREEGADFMYTGNLMMELSIKDRRHEVNMVRVEKRFGE